MPETAVSVVRADPDDGRAPLGNLLREYHEWMERMATHAGHSYDADASVRGDLEDFDRGTASAWLAVRGNDHAGCALCYDVAADVAELKRLYVRPAHRSHGVGRALTETLVDAAIEHGHETVALTTPPWSERAHALYDALGFERTEPYPETRLPERYHDGAIFMQLSPTEGGRLRD